MNNLSICVLTYNSERTIYTCIKALKKIADEFIVVDSGSQDKTITILRDLGIRPIFNSYTTHANQMNFAISKASNSWVLCMDSDEIIDDETIINIKKIKKNILDETIAYRISRYWHILDGKQVHSIYPVSSPDFPVRLFNKNCVKFNDSPVDDKALGFNSTQIIKGYVYHNTFYNLHELFNKLNSYTSRVVKYKTIQPSLCKAFLHPLPAFFKWYFFKGGIKDGKEGLVCSIYASLYTFLKYFKSWYFYSKEKEIKKLDKNHNNKVS